MDLEKLLRSVPLARRNFLYIATAFMLLMGPAISLYYAFVYGDAIILLNFLFSIGIGVIVATPIWLFIMRPKDVRLALEKADYMHSCLQKLDRMQKDTIETEIRTLLGRIWRSKTTWLSTMQAEAVLGEHCLYGKVLNRRQFGVNQHVILPYQNISDVLIISGESVSTKPGATAGNMKQLGGALAGAAFAAATSRGDGGLAAHFENRPTVIVVDDAANEYRIDVKDVEVFLSELKEKLAKLHEKSA